jgi:hypothetical protein
MVFNPVLNFVIKLGGMNYDLFPFSIRSNVGKSVVDRVSLSPTRVKGGSDPRSDDRNETGLWRLNDRTNRVAPALDICFWRPCFSCEFVSSLS